MSSKRDNNGLVGFLQGLKYSRFVQAIIRFIPDKLYLKLKYRAYMGKKLNLDNPVTFNEKLQWLKLYDRRPEYTRMVDKYTAKEYVAEILGESFIIPTLGVWDKPEDIEWDRLPDKFVLKTTTGGGNLGVVICKDKSKFDKDDAILKLKKSARIDIYAASREWPYKNAKNRIIAEELLFDESNPDESVADFKFTCFNGHADNVMACYDRSSGDTKFYFFDRNWNLLRLNKRGVAAPEGFTMPKPENLEEMYAIADKLSEGIPYARIDLYNVNGKVYFGEITFYPNSGYDRNILPETDAIFGEKLKLKI